MTKLYKHDWKSYQFHCLSYPLHGRSGVMWRRWAPLTWWPKPLAQHGLAGRRCPWQCTRYIYLPRVKIGTVKCAVRHPHIMGSKFPTEGRLQNSVIPLCCLGAPEPPADQGVVLGFRTKILQHLVQSAQSPSTIIYSAKKWSSAVFKQVSTRFVC